MNIPLVDLKAQYLSIKSDIDSAIARVISDGNFIKGPYVSEFEDRWAAYSGRKYCVSCANGTDAIEIGLRACGIGEGDEVIVPAHTWISTSEAVTAVGAQVVFADTCPESYNIDPIAVSKLINKATKAIIAVHLYGQPADMDPLVELANRNNLILIEDVAQAHAATYKGKKIGTFGLFATYSFFPGKNLGAYGDAGAIVMDDPNLDRHCRVICDHGQQSKHDHVTEGRNSRLDAIQASVLLAKLPHLEFWTERRIEGARIYDRYLEAINQNNCGDMVLPTRLADRRHVFHLYAVRLRNRDAVLQCLAANGVSAGIHYPKPLPLLKAYERLGHSESDFPVATMVTSQVISLPIYPEISEEQISYVVEKLTLALR